MDEHQALGLLPAAKELMKQADEDLEAFRAQVKNKKRRRAVLQGSTPIELMQLLLLPNYRIKRRSDALADTRERMQCVTDKTPSDEENEGIEQPLKHIDDKARMKAVKHEEEDVLRRNENGK